LVEPLAFFCGMPPGKNLILIIIAEQNHHFIFAE
jgi:hypothetical protein